ncbi:MAG TPA: hypothetical protein VEV45_20780 [Streptosporangiaceae bacterium]|nr:hypothetical protein [Streptosporangiaceae bacterium]
MTQHAFRWIEQFGAAYDVPEAILSEAGLEDVSWHNDACPCFGSQANETDVCIWVEHPDPERREMEGPRFTVSWANGETVFGQTDDVQEALRLYRKLTAGRIVGVDIPMRVVARVDPFNNKVVGLVIMPMEGDAGYFGPKAETSYVMLADQPDNLDVPITPEDKQTGEKIWEADWTELLASLPPGVEWSV